MNLPVLLPSQRGSLLPGHKMIKMKYSRAIADLKSIDQLRSKPKRSSPPRRYIRAQATPPEGAETLFAGIDFGTSGARLVIIDEQTCCQADIRTGYSAGEPPEKIWESTLFHLLQSLPEEVKRNIASIAIDGTSATTMLVDASTNEVLAPPKLYAEAQPPHVVRRAKAIAPPDHTATASTSTFCKLLTWDSEKVWQRFAAEGRTPIIAHQADWLASLLHGQPGISDWNNCLKLGYDPGTEEYPDWLIEQGLTHLIPTSICAPGTPIAALHPVAARRTGIPEGCIICAGTTDSIAAFLAAGVDSPGQAVTSLGSTLAIKMVSHTRVDDARYGVYSHRLGDSWLVGGASNTGGAVLRKHFSDAELVQLTEKMDPGVLTGLDYYPLTSPGERFPVNDPGLQPRLTPRPKEDAVFLQGILEGIAAVEAQAYTLLSQLGAAPVTEVYTAGGGAKNPVWTELRQKFLGVPVFCSANGEAAYGAALLARQGHTLSTPIGVML